MINQLVSIITPLYNCSLFFEETFNSVINQTYKNWEWIIIDDCSTDNSYEIAQKLSMNEKRIKLFRFDANNGTAKARNKGISESSGRYITFLDADDLLDANYLFEQLTFIQTNGPIVSSCYRRIASKTTTVFHVPTSINYKKLLHGNPLSCLTTFYDKAIIGEAFFPENIEKPEDYVFWLDILKRGFVAHGNPKILATYRIHNGSKSYKKIKLIKFMFQVYHKTQNINWLFSCFYVIRWMFYGFFKYRGVK